MKVLYFHQHFTTPTGAGGTRSYEMSKRLIAQGHRVTMVCGSYSGGNTGIETPFLKGVRLGEVEGINVVEFDLRYSNADGFWRRSLVFLRFSLSGIRLVFTEKYDVLFATSTPLTAAIPGIVAKWFRRKPFVFEVRDLWPSLPREMGVIRNPLVLLLLSILEWLAYHSANRLIGLAPGIVDGIVARGIDRKNVSLVPNGCDLALFGAPKPAGLNSEDLFVIYSGTHGVANGLDAVLDGAIELKHRAREDIKIVLIGSGKLKPRLEERARLEEIANIQFLDPVGKEELAKLLTAADVGLQILGNVPGFYFGTSPNKFFDYIAAGKAVLINYPGWVADMVSENDIGWAVPPGDSAAFADALIKAADDRIELRKMGERARLFAEENFDRDKLAPAFVKTLELAVAARSAN